MVQVLLQQIRTITISFAAVSEEPVVSIGGDLTGLEFTNSSVDGSDHQVALSNVTFSIADAGAVASADAKIEVKAPDGVSAISGVTIDCNSGIWGDCNSPQLALGL